MTASRKRGFTLIEVLIALTIVALAGVVVYGALSTALTSWSAGLVDSRRSQVAQIALDRISQQLKSTLSSTAKKDGRIVAAFTGDEHSIRFVTLGAAGGSPLAAVSYAVEDGEDGPQFVYREYPWPDKDFLDPKDPWTEEEVPEIVDLTFVFRKAVQDLAGVASPGAGEGEIWEPGKGRDLPAEVEISITSAGDGPPEERTIRTVVPVMTSSGV